MLPRGGLVEEKKHERILRRAQKKTDSPRSSKILLPGSWNQVAEAPERVGMFPDSVCRQFRIEIGVRIWPMVN